MNTILVTPVTTEKAYGQSQKNVYVFNVPLAANKNEILAAVESQYGVKVAAIKTLVQSGKAIRFSRGKFLSQICSMSPRDIFVHRSLVKV